MRYFVARVFYISGKSRNVARGEKIQGGELRVGYVQYAREIIAFGDLLFFRGLSRRRIFLNDMRSIDTRDFSSFSTNSLFAYL